ncbi:MAG TPA: transglycosylase SLT domain-containing protein [Candidatus Competibacter sp.]|nr:transglycosylase SLT domain-containing protein [Candidatus Competibacter sp.]
MIHRRPQRGATYRDSAAEIPDGKGRVSPRRWRAISAVVFLLALAGDIGATESLQSWREAFQSADRSLQNGEQVDYSALRAYPLYPYLRYRDLSRRLPEWPAAEIGDFLQHHADSPLSGQLRNAWLRQLAKTNRWDDYLRDAVPSRDPTLDCWRRQALLNAGQGELALRGFAAFWLRGASLPVACDPVIAAWRTRDGLPPALLWQRFALAMTNRNLGLARALRTDMPAADQSLADAWLLVAGDPQHILDLPRSEAVDPRIAEILGDGLKRWGKQDALGAAAALDVLKERYRPLAPRLADAERLLALWIASDYDSTALARLTALPDSAVDGAVREWRVRVCLRQNDWTAALRWLDQLSAPEQNSPRWQYWRGRALEELGKTEEARQVYRSIAGQRDYHGFLAADRLGISYAIANVPLAVPATELDALLAGSAGLQRARELYVLGREAEAEAEWRQATQSFDGLALKRAALLAHRWDWHHQAIVTIARAEYWDDLDLRFPLAYRDGVVNNARAGALDPAWVYAVIRQESGFRSDARSPAGALGLMQLMPATGLQIARELRDEATDASVLLRTDTNIRYGVQYLQRMLERLQNNPVLATAAYNAGPNKIAQWLPARTPVSADVWAETIPYQETRSYVQRVLEYATIYAQRLSLPEPVSLGARMRPIQPAEPIAKSSG